MSSNDLAVLTRGLSKSYLIAHNSNGPTTLREAIVERVKHPFGVNGQERETFWALNDVDFDIRQGETVGIIGRNGAGKSTLLKILSRITYPTRGVEYIYGRVASLLEVGTGFHGGLHRPREHRAQRQHPRHVAAGDQEQVRRDRRLRRGREFPGHSVEAAYSSGMYVRLAFAVAAHLDPQILIVDEVLAVGDFAFQKKCLGKMQEVSGAGRTVLFVSHNMAAVVQLCNRALLFRKGGLALDGDAESVVQAYITEGQTEQEDILDFADTRRPPNLNGRARIISARLHSEDRAGPWAISYGTPVSLELQVVVERPVSLFEFGIALCSASGAEFGSSFSRDVVAPSTVEPGEYLCEIAFPTLKLCTGSYYFDLGIRSDRGMEDYLLQAIHFEVLPNTESAEAMIHQRRGQVIPELSFSIKELQTQSGARAGAGAVPG